MISLKHNPGDRVKIISERNESFDSHGKMDCWLGTVMTIRKNLYDGYIMVEDNGLWMWDDSTIEHSAVGFDIPMLF